MHPTVPGAGGAAHGGEGTCGVGGRGSGVKKKTDLCAPRPKSTEGRGVTMQKKKCRGVTSVAVSQPTPPPPPGAAGAWGRASTRSLRAADARTSRPHLVKLVLYGGAEAVVGHFHCSIVMLQLLLKQRIDIPESPDQPGKTACTYRFESAATLSRVPAESQHKKCNAKCGNAQQDQCR